MSNPTTDEPPQEIMEMVYKIAAWATKQGWTHWELGPIADRAALVTERELSEQARAAQRHMNACRGLLKVPEGEVLYDAIEELQQQLARAEREVGHNTAVALGQQIIKLEDQLAAEQEKVQAITDYCAKKMSAAGKVGYHRACIQALVKVSGMESDDPTESSEPIESIRK